jgi:PhnB protein
MANKVAPVPRGFRTVTPCLTVIGVQRAIEFYQTALGAEEKVRLYDAAGLVALHAELKIGNSIIFLAEEDPALGILSPTSLGGSPTLVHLYVADVDQVWQQALAAGAAEVVPLADTYWGDRFGKIADPFGHVWAVASRVENVPFGELVERTKAATQAPACNLPA